jgi:transcriptional regulator with XRE-family HTH domain
MAGRKRESKRALRRLGVVLASLRNDAGLTQEEVAAAAGITPRYLQMLERGTANPSYIALWALASTLQVDLAEVIKRAELLDAR